MKESKLSETGLQHDRRWLIVDASTNRFISQRTHPKLALIQPNIVTDSKTGSLKGLKLELIGPLDKKALPITSLFVPLVPFKNPSSIKRKVEIWDRSIDGAVDQGDEVADFLTKYLQLDEDASSNNAGKFLRLVYLDLEGGSDGQKINSKYALSEKDISSYSDGYPILLASEQSLEALNSKLKTQITMHRFRPNIVGMKEKSISCQHSIFLN
jgi:uncharacterized protein YcbX